MMLWLLLAVFLALSGLISATETALFGLPRRSLYEFGQTDRPFRRRVHRLMQEPRRVLMTVLIANTTFNVTIFAISFFALRELGELSPMATAAIGAAVLLSVIVFGEMLPKAIALSDAARFAPAAGGVVALLQTVLGPIQWVLATFLIGPITRLIAPGPPAPDTVSTEELRYLVEQSARQGIINPTENGMLQAVVALAEATVREIMTPRVDIRSVHIDMGRDTALKEFSESRRRRLPVYGRSLDDVRGVLYARDLYLNPTRSVSSLVRRVHFIPEQVKLTQLLRHFRTERIQMAIVVDEHGGTAGLVTAEDVAEWIVGDLPDAESPRPTATTEQIDRDSYRIWGDLSVRVWADRFGVGEIDRRIDTVAGLILSKLGRLPQVGDVVHLRNLSLTVESLSGRRIERVLLRLDAGATADTEPVL